MTFKDQYSKNKPLFHSIVAGIFYFLLYWSLDFGSASRGFLTLLMILLPGISFPLTTCYFKTGNFKNPILKNIIHFFISLGIYQIVFFIFYIDFVGDGNGKFMIIFAGFLGSFLFQFMTKYLLKKEITFSQIVVTSVLSGIAFIPYVHFGKKGTLLGLAVFLWTIVNGILLNSEYKEANNNTLSGVKINT